MLVNDLIPKDTLILAGKIWVFLDFLLPNPFNNPRVQEVLLWARTYRFALY